MNDHLTHQEFTDYLLGARSATVEAHLADCSTCSKELYQFKESTESFRSAVHTWSEAPHAVRPEAREVPRSFDWLLVGAMVLVLATFATVYFGDRPNTKESDSKQTVPLNLVADNSADQIQKDNELLSNINQELSEELPAPMQPLQVSVSRQATGNSNSNE